MTLSDGLIILLLCILGVMTTLINMMVGYNDDNDDYNFYR